jgi:hypothetical protein
MKALKILLAVAVAVMMMSSVALAELSISANVEVNTDFKSTTEESSVAGGSDTEETVFEQGGRVKVTFEEKTEAESGLYAALKGSFEIKDDGSAAGSDAYFELGSAGWLMKVGRVEGEGLYGKGADIYIVGAPGAPGRYEVNKSRGRGDIGGLFAFMPSDALKAEVDMMYSSNDDNNIMGARPLVKFSASGLTVKAGVDYYMESPKNADAKGEVTKLGFGGNAEFAMDPITLGASVGMLTDGGKDAVPVVDDLGIPTGEVGEVDKDEEKTLSVFGYAKMSMGVGTLGVGGGMTTFEYDKASTEKSMMEFYGSFDAPLPVDGAAIKLGVSYATAKLEKQGVDADGVPIEDQENSAFGGRLRLWYEF